MNTHTRSLILTLAFLGLTALLSLTPLAQSERASAASIMGKRQESNAKVPPCAGAHESGLPLPSSFLPNKLPQFQAQLKTFLTSGKYRNLNWCEDKGLRDTGPFINGVSYGVHPTVKIYYSPSVIRWLLRTNPDELIPDGAIIIKEQYSPPPAARYQFQPPPLPKDWTIMIKDSKGSKDGWYWAEIWDTQCADNNDPPFAVPYAGFGIYCTRCHASAEKELTFSDTKNIKGFPGDPETYFIDLSWASASSPHPSSPPPPCTETSDSDYGVPTGGHSLAHPDLMQQLKSLKERPAAGSPNSQFISFYNSIAPVPLAKVRKIPGETFDHIFAQNLGPAAAATPGPSPNPNQFLTSDACMGCHSAGTYGNVMLYTGARQTDGSTPTMNVSPFGEWRWSPMGLAGRDPIFYAQLDSEIAFVKSFFKNDPAKMEENIKLVNNTCFKCHGVMGKRRLDDDHGGTGKGNFEREFIYTTYDTRPQPGNRQAYVYGALARDGVSCMACHRIVKDQPSPGEPDPLTDFLKNRITGNFTTGNPGEVFGPFEDQEIVTDPMNNALGIKPKHDPYIKTSRMCGNCHTINLPLMDNPTLNPDKPHLEQVTYLEWLNSGYQDEFGNNPKAQTCQDCHMTTKYSNAKGTLNIPLIQQPIAFIEDDQYPQVGNRLARDKIRVRFREKGFARHQLQGLNVSLLEMFRQSMSGFNSNGNNMQASLVLGVRQNDYMSGLDDLSTAIDAFVQQAQNSTAELSLSPVTISNDKLFANVLVTNKAGHRLPSGVGFRRAFLEFRVIDGSNGQTVWCSGCTNELGVILKGNSGPRLPSELFDVYKDGSKPLNHDYPTPCNNQYLPGINPQHYQPHFFWNIEKGSGSAITRQDQVQIYEELNLNVQCALTTSFLRRDYQLKDNRLLPYGWTSTGPLRPDNTPYIPEDFLHETRPVKVGDDPAYKNGSGTNVVRYEVALPAGTNPGNLTVKATLYYQSIPPYYLNDRFTQAPNEPATQRLYYLTSNLQTKGTPIENWKLKIASGSQTVVAR